MKVNIILLVVIAFFSINAYTAVLPPVISSDLTLPAGIHTVSASSIVNPGVTLTFSSVSTLQFVNVDSKLIVYGTLNANGTTFTGDTPADKWGQIICKPGSSCTLLNCAIDNGGGTDLPPPPLTNAMLYAEGANILISNTVATRSQGDCFGFKGGNIIFVDNTALAGNLGYGNYSAVAIFGSEDYSTYWVSSGNVLTGGTKQGIWLQGDFLKDLNITARDTRLNVDKITISNSIFTVALGTTIAFYDYAPGSLTLYDAKLVAIGTASSPILFTNFYGKNPWLLKAMSSSKVYFNNVIISQPGVFSLSNAYLCVSNTFFSKLSNGLDVNYESELCAYKSTFSGIINNGVVIKNSSSAYLRECTFKDNNAPYINSLYTDESSFSDARYCWWNAADGPYPYGAFNNERINTNANVMAFPWLLTSPGSQINPPEIYITSHTREPIIVTTPQILIKGVVSDDSKIEKVTFQNLNRKIIGVANVSGTNWEANVWLFSGVNYIGFSAYDNEGNATVVGTIVECTGDGCGDGGKKSPLFIPLADRTIQAGKLLEFAVSAISKREPVILTYWASNLPEDAQFDSAIQKFSWLPTTEGVYSNIVFCVTDGTYISSNTLTLTVTQNESENILTVNLPDAYVGYPYYFHFCDDNVNGLTSWEYENATMPSGLFISRSGIICGTPYNQTFDKIVQFTAKAINSSDVESKTKNFTLRILTATPSELFKVYTQEIPYKLTGAVYNVQLIATNGLAPYTWIDTADMIKNLSGLTVSNNGILSGVATASGFVPATWYVKDVSNKSTYAKIPIPIIGDDNHLLKVVPGKNKCKIIIKRIPGKTAMCKMIVSVFITPPANFVLEENMIATLKVGYGFVDGEKPAFKFIAEKKLLYKKKETLQLRKILVKKLTDGQLKVKFLIKNVDYNNTFNDFGITDGDVLAGQAEFPFWVRIGNYCTETTTITATVKSKTGKFTKCISKW